MIMHEPVYTHKQMHTDNNCNPVKSHKGEKEKTQKEKSSFSDFLFTGPNPPTPRALRRAQLLSRRMVRMLGS